MRRVKKGEQGEKDEKSEGGRSVSDKRAENRKVQFYYLKHTDILNV